MAQQLTGQAAVVQIDTQADPALASRFGISSIPVTLLLRNGRVVDRLPGAQSAAQVLAWFRQHTPDG